MSTRRRPGTWQDEVARGFSRLFSRTSSQEKEEEEGPKEPAEEPDRGLSRLFFRSPSQEKKERSDRTEHGEEQERSHSPSRLFFRKVTQENKGGNDPPAKGNKEEQDRSRGFSRLFSRTSSQEKEEASDSARGASEEHNRPEDNPSDLTLDNHEESTTTEPEQVTLEPNFSPIPHNISEPAEEKDGESTHHSKVLDSEKQSRENFFHFLGNLFHFSPKSPQGNSKQGAGVQEPCREPEDAQVKNNLDKEEISQKSRLDDHSRIEEASEESTTWQEQENPGVSGGEAPQDVLKHYEDEAKDTLILNGHTQDAPSITYGTYRGSRRIRKLLKRRADVNSPIPEKEETPETSYVGDATTESCLLHQSIQMELVSEQNYQGEVPSSEIHIKIERNHEPPDQNSELHNDDNFPQKAKNSSDLEIEAKDSLIGSNIVDVDTEKSLPIVEGQQPNLETFAIVPQLSSIESLESLLPNTRDNIEDLQPIVGESLNINILQNFQNAENSEDHLKESSFSKIFEPNNKEHATDIEPKTMDILDSVTPKQPNTDEVSKQPEDPQPNFKESVNFPDILRTSIDYNSKTDTDLCPKVEENFNILPNTKDDIEHVNANTDISNSEKSETFSVMDNFQSEAKDAFVRIEEIEESLEENKKVPVDLGNCVAVNTQSALQQSDLKMVLASEETSQQAVEVNLHSEEKPHKELCDNSHLTTHNRIDKSSDRNYEDANSPPSVCLQASIERRPNILDFQSNALLVSSNTVDVIRSRMDNSIMGKQQQLQEEEHSKLQNQEFNSTSVNKGQPESKDTPNLHLHLNETIRTSENPQQENGLQNGKVFLQTEPQPNTKVSFKLKELSNTLLEIKLLESDDIINVDLQPNDTFRTSKELKQAEHIEHPQTNTNIFPENDILNDEELLKSEQQPNIKVSFQSKDLNNPFLEKTPLVSKETPDLDLQLRETSITSKDLKQIVNIEHVQTNAEIFPENDLQNYELPKTEQQPNIKMSSPLKEMNNTFLEKIPAESRDITNLDLQLSETSRTSKDLKQTGNIEHMQANANNILENDIQNDEELVKTEQKPNIKVSFQSKDLNNPFLGKTPSVSKEIPGLDLWLSETSTMSKDLKQIVNIEHVQTNANIIPKNDLQNDELPMTEQQPNIKMSSPLKEMNNTFLEKIPAVSRDISDLDLQLSETSRTSKDLKQIVNIEHVQTNAETIPKNDLQNEELPKAEQQPNIKMSSPFKELNNTFFVKTPSESNDIPDLDLQLSETSKTSKDLKQIGNIEHVQANANNILENDLQNDEELVKTEQQPNIKVSFQPKDLNNQFLEKKTSVSIEIPDLDLRLSEPSTTSKDLKPIVNIEHVETNANIIPENYLQNDELPKTAQQTNITISSPFKEMNNTFLVKNPSASKDIPDLDLQLSETSRTSKNLKQIGNMEQLHANANIMPENYLQNEEELLKTEQEPSTNVSFQLKDLNNTFLEKIPAESKDIPDLDIELSETSRMSKDLKQIVNIEHVQTNANIIPENDLQNKELPKAELQPNIKMSSPLKELNNTFLVKTPSESKDIPDLDLQLSETSRTSKDLKQIGNIEHLQANAETIPEHDPQKDVKFLQLNTKVTFQLKESPGESPLKSKIISERIEKKEPNIHVPSNISDGIETEVEKTSEVNLCLEPNSEMSVPKISNDSLVHKVSKSVSGEGLLESGHSNGLADETNAYVDEPDGAILYDTLDNMAVPQSCSNDISLPYDHGAVTSRNISFDNGIECRSPSPPISDSSSYADCSDVQFDSPNDSGIVSSQAYTPDEHFLYNTLPSEIPPEPLEVDQKSEEASVPKHDSSSVNVPNAPVLQNKEPVRNIHNVSEEENTSLEDGCASYLASNASSNVLTPDKQINLNSDVYFAKVSVKTVNIEEVKISPYVLCSDIISVGTIESPTFTKEVICIPNLSPTATDAENVFQVFHCVEDDKDFVTNNEIPNDKGGYVPGNNCEKNPDRSIDNQSPIITNKSADELMQNFKNNNINVSTSDNVINSTLQAYKSETKLANEALMSSESLKELGGSLSELSPDLLLSSSLLHDVTDTNGIISSCSTMAKMIPPDEKHFESSNELFEQKANEIILSVLHSAIDELHHINIMKENHRNLEDQPAEVLVDCPGKPSDHILIGDTDLIMSMAVGIVNDVISSSKQLVVSNIIPDVLSEDIATDEATKQKPPKDFNYLSLDNQSDLVKDATNSNHVLPPSDYDNIVHLPSFEINSNVLHVETGAAQNGKFIQATEPKSLTESSPLDTKEVSENGADRTIENNILTENEEHLSSSRVQSDTDNLMNENYNNRDFTLDDMYCARQMESISFGTEGSMEDLIYINTFEETSNSPEFSDLLQFSVYNSRYVEISESDDESIDEEKDNSSEQASGNDSFLSVQSRRVRIYPFSLSPIYEDDSAYEDTLSNSSSPRFNEGATASNSGHDHTSILSLLQSVSDRLKETDLEETSPKERFLSLGEVNVGNDKVNNQGAGEPEDTILPSKTSLDVPSTLEDEKAPLGKRSGLFITKSLADKPNPVAGRQSFLLNLTSHSKIYGAKPSVESNPVPSVTSETPVSPITKSNPDQSPDISPSMAAVNSLSPEPVLPVQRSTLEDKSRMSSDSVFYQYFHSARNYVSNAEDKGSPREKLEESKKTAELDMDPADSDSLKFNPRPGKVIISDIKDKENKIELKADILDATSWVFPNGVNIRVIRGCWILYEKTHFEGQAHVLEEGEAVLRHLWDLPGGDSKLDKMAIGSVKRVVKDYLPEVVISSLQDVSDSPIYIRTEVPSLENLVGKHPRSIAVNSGVWLAYTELQYSGTVTVLEEGCELPLIQDSGLKSMRPLKMGGLKVQLPSDPKIIIYEKANFQGRWREITEHVSSLRTLTGDGENSGGHDVGSIQVIGGMWVGYENERYKGHQYLLEEGDYEDWQAWGGYNNIFQSLRYLQADFLESSVTLYETEEEDGKQLNLFNQAIPDLELAGYGPRMQCIHVKKGMWVAYQQKHFCGEQYILEKGRYKTYLDWGGSNNTIMSIRPVLLEPLGLYDMKHLIKAYTRADFQGETMDFTQGVSDFTSFMPMSFKVLRGCWLLCYKADTSDNLCVLEEGLFPDLASCGCPTAQIKSIKPIDYVFAEPSISLFALDSCEGRQLHFDEAVTSILNKDLHFYVQSVWVRGGLWIAFEGANFLGRQMLLDPQQILNWSQFSGWKAIGSLRPLKQPSVYFMVRNRDKDKYLTVSGKPADSRATFVTISPRNGQNTQIWYFCRGFLKSKANDLCLDVIGGKNIPGSKVSLWAEHGKTRQKWKVNKDGTISSNISDDLVLDLRGGNYYDQNYTVVNKFQENAPTQKWEVEIL